MKVLTFICIGCFLLLTICVIYTQWETKNFIESLPKPPVIESDLSNDTQQISSEDVSLKLSVKKWNSTNQSKVSTRDGANPKILLEGKKEAQRGIDNEQKDEVHPDEQEHHIESWEDIIAIAEQEARARGTWIGDPKTMDPEELYKAEYNQMLEQFGDIPAVHTAMKYKHKFNNNLPISFDKEIEWQKALVELYPNETNKKTLAYYRWLYPRGSSPGDIGDITPVDIAHLRSMGISVETKMENDNYVINISTE